MSLPTLRTPTEKHGLDCSNPWRKQFIEIQPFAVDPETGEILNQSPCVALKEVAPINQDEQIQSFFESTDLKTCLNRIRHGSGEDLPVANGEARYLDLSNLPKNVMELDAYIKNKKAAAETAKKNPKEKDSSVQANVVSQASGDDLDAKIKSYIDRKLSSQPVQSETKEEKK